MTQHYLAGELSLFLARLQGATPGGPAERAVRGLRLEAETRPPAALASVAVRALTLGDELCWDALARGDAEAFGRRAACCSELYEFCVCADLLDDRHRGPGDQQRGSDHG